MLRKITIQAFGMNVLFAVLAAAGMVATPSPLSAQGQPSVALTLNEAINLALKENRSLRISRLSVSESEHKKEAARAAYFPQIRNESGISHVTALAGVEIPAGSFGVPPATGAIPGQTLFIGQGSDTSYTSGTQLAQPLTQMLKIRESNRAAAADIAVSKIHLTQAENDVIVRVRQLYFSSLIAELKFEAAQQQLKASELTYQEDAKGVDNGRMLEVTALEGHATMLDAKQEVLTQKLQLHDLMLSLDDALGLPLSTQLVLNAEASDATLSLPTRPECVRAALAQSSSVLEAQQAVTKAKAGLGAARDAYVPDVTGLARYSYQSGIPLLVHNFGSFGFSLNYDLFDGGRRNAENKVARTALSEAYVNLDKVQHEVEVAVESSYDRVDQLQGVLEVAKESLGVRTEAARLADRKVEQNAALESTQAEAHAKVTAAKAALLEATLGVSLAQADLMRIMGKAPR